MASDAELMERTLVAVADSGIEIRHRLYERFFAAYPERKPIFYNVEVSSQRMTDETVQMMFGLASEERWVWPLIAELTFTHRNYGPLPMEEYNVFIDMTVDELGAAAGARWTPDAEAAWRRQGERLKILILEAREGWSRVMPGQKTGMLGLG